MCFISLQGNFGDVFRGIYKPDKLEVAVKTCRETLSEEAKKKFLQEGRILKQYDHPNIVKFVGIAATRQPVMIVMEYVPGRLPSRCNQAGCVLDRDRDRDWDRCYVETIHTLKAIEIQLKHTTWNSFRTWKWVPCHGPGDSRCKYTISLLIPFNIVSGSIYTMREWLFWSISGNGWAISDQLVLQPIFRALLITKQFNQHNIASDITALTLMLSVTFPIFPHRLPLWTVT